MRRGKEEIKRYYSERNWSLKISLITSMIGGLIAGILLSIALGQSPQEPFKDFSIILWMWGGMAIFCGLIFYGLLWAIFIFVPRFFELRKVKKDRKL